MDAQVEVRAFAAEDAVPVRELFVKMRDRQTSQKRFRAAQ